MSQADGTLGGEEPANEALLTCLDKIPGLRQRFEKVELGHPLIGSSEAHDCVVRYGGDRPGGTASIKLSVALDHLTTWRRVIYDARVIPMCAHFTLLRPVFEGAVQSRWLLDPDVDAATRVRRALGAAIADLRWRGEAETDMLLHPSWKPSVAYVTAAARIAELKQQAAAADLRPISMPSTPKLLKDYALHAPGLDTFAFRYTSGILHGQSWAAVMGDLRARAGETIGGFIATGDQGVAAGFTASAVEHFDAAVRAYEGYVEPETPPSQTR